MSEVVLNQIRKGFYLDSVALMRKSRSIAAMEGVTEAAMMMGTQSNRAIMGEAGLLAESGEEAGGGDLIIGIRAVSESAGEAAMAEANTQLEQPAGAGGEGSSWQPKSLKSALKSAPQSNLALISVPGEFAIAEAIHAIRNGLDVMIFSDNIQLSHEAQLKHEARELGRLVMGPDCGTAIVNGVGLAFANNVRRGDIGLVGASGTGLQEITCLVSRYGGGVSHAIGVGGRDLNMEIGGISTLTALEALAADTSTRGIVLVSKPPPKEVTARILDCVAQSGKPTTICFIGADEMEVPPNAVQVATLKVAARSAMGLAGDERVSPPSEIAVPPTGKLIKGLYSGGTLCAEAQVVLRAAGQTVYSNAPIPGVSIHDEAARGHTILDLGADEYTLGRPHPMINPAVRDDEILATLSDQGVGVVLLDVVIGYGSHPDPAGHLAELLDRHAEPNGPAIIASVTGTDGDPQNRSAQIAKLTSAGVHVAPTNIDAANWALSTVLARD